MAAAERWAAGIACPAYAIDDETAIEVVDGTVEFISEGHWKLVSPQPGSERIALTTGARPSGVRD
jgi:hypothetical protein